MEFKPGQEVWASQGKADSWQPMIYIATYNERHICHFPGSESSIISMTEISEPRAPESIDAEGMPDPPEVGE